MPTLGEAIAKNGFAITPTAVTTQDWEAKGIPVKEVGS